MTSFQDQFNRADADLDGENGWDVIASDDVEAGRLELINRTAQNDDAVAAVAFQETSAPTTNEQEVSGYITSTAEATENFIDLIINGAHDTTYTDRKAGVVCRLSWLANSERKLEILQEDISAANYSTYTAATLTMVNAGGTVQTGYHGHLIGDGAVDTLQHVRLVVREKDYGLEASVYVNSGDDDRPTLVAQLRTDLVTAVGTAGHWGFAMGAAVANTLILAEFQGKDYAPGIAVDSVLKSNHPSLLELRDRVKRKFSKGANTDLDNQYVDDIIGEEVEQIVLSLGDNPWFLIRKGNLTLTIDGDGFATMPSYVESVLKIERQNRKMMSTFTFETLESDGDVTIRLSTEREATGEVHIVTYIQRWERMDKPDDLCVIPRKHDGLVVYAACARIAGTGDRLPGLEQAFARGAEAKLAMLKKEQSRYFRMTKTRLRPRRRAVALPYEHPHRRY